MAEETRLKEETIRRKSLDTWGRIVVNRGEDGREVVDYRVWALPEKETGDYGIYELIPGNKQRQGLCETGVSKKSVDYVLKQYEKKLGKITSNNLWLKTIEKS